MPSVTLCIPARLASTRLPRKVLLDLGKPADATGILLKASLIENTDADNLALLGRAYLESGDAAKAIPVLRNAVAFVPTDWADPYTNLAAAYAKVGRVEEAAWANAMAAFATGNPGRARDGLLKLTAGPAATDAYIGLGLIATASGDRATAAEAYRKALAAERSGYLLLAYSDFLQRAGRSGDRQRLVAPQMELRLQHKERDRTKVIAVQMREHDAVDGIEIDAAHLESDRR